MRTAFRFRNLLLALAGLVGCGGSPTSGAVQPSPPPVTITAKAGLESTLGGAQPLEVPGFLPAVLFVPEGHQPRPLVVAAHGAGGAPEWECDYWARLTAERAFVLCLRGTRINPQAGFYFRDHRALDAELTAALAAARLRFPRIASNSGIYAGFSQGASMGALIVDRHAGALPYVVLIEGFQRWNVPLGRAFAKQGGKAVLFACGTRDCANAADVSLQALQRAGPRARAEHAMGAGHTPAGQVEALVASSLPWLLAGDAAWLEPSL